jgi:hypothetical protein
MLATHLFIHVQSLFSKVDPREIILCPKSSFVSQDFSAQFTIFCLLSLAFDLSLSLFRWFTLFLSSQNPFHPHILYLCHYLPLSQAHFHHTHVFAVILFSLFH